MAETPTQGQLLILAAKIAGAEPYLAAARKLHLAYAFATKPGQDQPRPAPAQTAGEDDRRGVAKTLPALRLDFAQRESALEIVQYAMEHPLVAIVAADDCTAPACARASTMLGLRWHSPRAADLCLDGIALQQRLGADFSTPVLGENPSGQCFAVAAILDGGNMRVLGKLTYASDRSQTYEHEPTEAPKAVYETILLAARGIGFSHGPLWARVCLPVKKIRILQIGPTIPAVCLDQLHFRIPLVDEDVSLAEVIVRHAVGMDISRIYARESQQSL